MKIYHGSQSVIEVPQYGLDKAGNDFGLGFYCTESEDLAKEWSVQPHRDGFANAYDIDIDGLNILRLNTPDFTTAEAAVYYPRRQARNDDAGREFGELLAKNDFNGLYMNAILAQRIGNDDERIPRNIAP